MCTHTLSLCTRTRSPAAAPVPLPPPTRTHSFIGDEHGNLKGLEIVDVAWQPPANGGPPKFEEVPGSARVVEAELVRPPPAQPGGHPSPLPPSAPCRPAGGVLPAEGASGLWARPPCPGATGHGPQQQQ